MATLQKTVEIIFGGKNEITGIIGDIEKDFNALGKSVDNVTTPLSKVATAVQAVDAALLAMVVGGLAYAVKTSGELEESFDQVAQRITASAGEIEKFKSAVYAYGTNSVRSLADINAALTESIQRGTNYKTALEQLSTAEQLAVATHSDLKSATVLLSTVMAAYGASISEAAAYGDIFTVGVKTGAGEVPVLAEELGKIAGIAKGMGIPLETLVAALSALGSYGVETSTALGGLKFMLANLLDPSKEAKEAAANLGIEFSAAAVKTTGLETVMKNAYVATNGNAEAMKVLFGSVKGLNIAFDLAGDSQGKFKDALVATRTATGVMYTEYEKFVGDFGNINTTLENNLKIAVGSIGDKLLPEYAKLSAGLAALLKGVKIEVDSGAFDLLFTFLGTVGTKMAAWMKGVATNMPAAFALVDWGPLKTALQEAGDAIGTALSIDTTSPESLAKAINLVISSLNSLLQVTVGMGEVFAPIITAAAGLVEGFNALDDSTKQMFGTIIANSLVYKLFGPIGIAMKYLGQDSELMSTVINTAFASLDNGINTVKVGVLSLAVIFAHAMDDMAKLLDYVPGLNMAADLVRTGDRVTLLEGMLEKANSDLVLSSDKVAAAFTGTGSKATETKSAVEKYADSLSALPESAKTRVEMTRGKETWEEITKIPDTHSITLEIDKTSKDKFAGSMTELLADGTVQIVDIYEAPELYTKVNSKINKNLADTAKDRKAEITAELKYDEARMKEQSDIVQKSIEWKAKIDIAQIEGAFKLMEQGAKNVGIAIESTGTTLSSMTKTWADFNDNGWDTDKAKKLAALVEAEDARRTEAFKQQKELNDATIKYMKSKTDAMEKGDALIKITGDGLKPHLEAFMWAVLEAVQIRANEAGSEFLLGMKGVV